MMSMGEMFACVCLEGRLAQQGDEENSSSFT